MIAIRIVWKSNGETIKDETVPYEGWIEQIGDSVTVQRPGEPDLKLEFSLEFDPHLPT